MAYEFPGNVRELENILERALALSGREEIRRRGPAARTRAAHPRADGARAAARRPSRCRSTSTRWSARRSWRRSARPASTAPRRRSSSASRSASCATGCSASPSPMRVAERACAYVSSPNQDERPPGTEITLVVLHSISLPPGEFGGDAIERLFTNRLDPAAHPYFKEVAWAAGFGALPHPARRRAGAVRPVERRAWHAGASSWRGRSRCNDFSVGVELEGTDAAPFEDAQYARLHDCSSGCGDCCPCGEIAAHSEIAPGRKTDPGPGFDWRRLLLDLGTSAV